MSIEFEFQLEFREIFISSREICKENTKKKKNSWIEVSDEIIPKPKIKKGIK